MTAAISQPEPSNVPADQRQDLLDCYFRDLSYAHAWLEETDKKPELLARLHYLIGSAQRLECAINTLSDSAAAPEAA